MLIVTKVYVFEECVYLDAYKKTSNLIEFLQRKKSAKGFADAIVEVCCTYVITLMRC